MIFFDKCTVSCAAETAFAVAQVSDWPTIIRKDGSYDWSRVGAVLPSQGTVIRQKVRAVLPSLVTVIGWKVGAMLPRWND
jgi:hypothetical protein